MDTDDTQQNGPEEQPTGPDRGAAGAAGAAGGAAAAATPHALTR